MATIIRTTEGCRAAYPSNSLDAEVLLDTCIESVLSGRGHYASHADGMPVWLDPYMQSVMAHPLVIIAAVICVIIWLTLSARVIGAPNLLVGQKWGWFLGLTFIFPVFSVLYLALAPVERRRVGPGRPLAPLATSTDPGSRYL